jgi:hypothetical protein
VLAFLPLSVLNDLRAPCTVIPLVVASTNAHVQVVMEVEFDRGANGFGFSIAGGIDDPVEVTRMAVCFDWLSLAL